MPEMVFGYDIDEQYLQIIRELLRKKALLMFAGPSGAGKGTITDLLFEENVLGIVKATLHTSRPMGFNERVGTDCFYISQQAFEEMRDTKQFLQWQQFPTRCYGLATQVLLDALAQGKCVLIDTGIDAAIDLKRFFVQNNVPCLDFFISPVAYETLASPEGMDQALLELKRRMLLRNRGETETDLNQRLGHARRWFTYVDQFSVYVPNIAGQQAQSLQFVRQRIIDYISVS